MSDEVRTADAAPDHSVADPVTTRPEWFFPHAREEMDVMAHGAAQRHNVAMAYGRMPRVALAVLVVVGVTVVASVILLAGASTTVPGVFLTGWPFVVCISIGCIGAAAIGGWLRVKGEISVAWHT